VTPADDPRVIPALVAAIHPSAGSGARRGLDAGDTGPRRWRRARHDKCSGFTLIETLVALVVFVAGYLVVHHSVSLGWRGAQAAWAESAASRLAQSRLAAAGVEARLEEGEQSGETEDGYRWTLRTERYRRPGSDGVPEKIAGYWVTVTVRWDGGVLRPARSLQLTTLKLGAAP
jgi:general secretion pathway protein I